MNVPRNVLYFEVLLYASLMLDALSVAFEDRTPTRERTEQAIMTGTLLSAVMIMVFVYVVWLAAQRHKNWARWVLVVALALSVPSLGVRINEVGLALDSAIEIVSCVVTAVGLYASFTGDAKGWFNA